MDSPPDSPIEIYHRGAGSSRMPSASEAEEFFKHESHDESDDCGPVNNGSNVTMNFRNIKKKLKSNSIFCASPDSDSPYRKMLSRQNTEKNFLQDDIIDSVTNELNDFIKNSFSRTNTEKSLNSFMNSPTGSVNSATNSGSDYKKSSRARSLADFSSLVSYLQPNPSMKAVDEELDEDDHHKSGRREVRSAGKTEDLISGLSGISPIKAPHHHNEANNFIEIPLGGHDNKRDLSNNRNDENDPGMINSSIPFDLSDLQMKEGEDQEGDLFDFRDPAEEQKKKELEKIEQFLRENGEDEEEMMQRLEREANEEMLQFEQFGAHPLQRAGMTLEQSLDIYKNQLEKEVDALIDKDPHYFKPTIASILPPYTNNELDMVKNSFFTTSYSTLKKLPDFLHPGEFERKKKKLIVENILSNSSSNFKPSSTAYVAANTTNKTMDKDNDKKLINSIEKLLPELNTLNKNYLTILANEKKKNIISHHHYLPNNNSNLDMEKNEFFEKNGLKDEKVTANFRFDPYIRKPFVVNSKGRSAGDDLYLTPLPHLTQDKEIKLSKTSDGLSKRLGESANSHVNSKKDEKPAAVFYSNCRKERGVDTTTRKLYTKNSKMELKKVMKQLYDTLSKDWKAYPFRLKYTKAHELLVQFISPELDAEDKQRIENETLRKDEESNQSLQAETVPPQSKSSSLPFPPPNNALVKYMRHLSRHGIVKDFGFHRRGDRWYVLEEEIEEENFDLNETEMENTQNYAERESLEEKQNDPEYPPENLPSPPPPPLALSSQLHRPLSLPDIHQKQDITVNEENEPEEVEVEDVEQAVNSTISLMFGSGLIVKDKDILRSSLTTSSFIQPNNHLAHDNHHKLSPHKESHTNSFLTHDEVNSYGHTLTAKPAKITTYLTFSFYAPWIVSNQFNTTKDIAKRQREKAKEYGQKKKEETLRLNAGYKTYYY